MTAFESLNSYTYDMALDMTMSAMQGTENARMVSTSIYTGGIDIDANEMAMLMDAAMTLETPLPVTSSANDSSPSPKTKTDSQNVSIEVYLVDNWAYLRTETTGENVTWVKKQISEVDPYFNVDFLKQQTVMLDSPSKIEQIRSETINGTDCHVFSVVPDKNAFVRYLSSQNIGNEALKGIDYEDILRSFSYYCYVTKDTSQLLKLDLKMILRMDNENMGKEDIENQTVMMFFDMSMNIGNHNQPFSVVLPDGAINAEESGSSF